MRNINKPDPEIAETERLELNGEGGGANPSRKTDWSEMGPDGDGDGTDGAV